MSRVTGRPDGIRHGSALAAIGIVLSGALSVGCSSKDSAPKSAAATSLAQDAFVWGYPLVVTQRTLQTFANLIGENQLFNQTALSTAGIRLIVSPNQDTLYSVAVLDLRSEPMVLSVPDVLDRYWTYQLLDGWTNSFHYIGTRATAGKGGAFVITPPGYAGPLPPSTAVSRIEAPTKVVFLLGRYLVRDDADAANVTALKRTLTPLSALLNQPAPAPPPALGAPPGKPAETGTTGAAFFDELGDALAVNGPATPDDEAALARFRSLGIGPGLHPASVADAGAATELESGVTAGLAQLDLAVNGAGIEKNGWRTFLDIGAYTSDFPLRATVAKFAWGANVPAEAVYPASTFDPGGRPYDGTRPYRMHFDGAGLPPVDAAQGFWSLTLYGADHFFVDNPINRYKVGDRTQGLTYNADGSLDVYIQSTSPTGHEGNWLPAPAAPFVLLLRLYLPSQDVQDGKYAPPPVLPQ